MGLRFGKKEELIERIAKRITSNLPGNVNYVFNVYGSVSTLTDEELLDWIPSEERGEFRTHMDS